MRYVISFDAATACDAELVGGKGANLGRLTAAGFTVPSGFTVTTEAYRAFLDEGGLARRVGALVDAVDFDDTSSVDGLTGKIREMISAQPFPPDVGSEIGSAYAQMGMRVRVAVRSSGTAEDLEGASFAGQHDTYLQIRGVPDVLDAVKRCWASLWALRATSYRQHRGFEQGSVGIAVVIQQMVDSEVSGVMFTANPVTTTTDEIGIDASWGLGEAVVSGIVTPDSFTLDLDTLRVKEKRLGSKEVCVCLDDSAGSGTVHEPVPPAKREIFSLSDQQIGELGEVGRQVMAYYRGRPVDIEWALAGSTFYLLQARPITGAAFSWDELLEDPQYGKADDDTIWSRVLSDDGWTGAITPLFYSIRGHAAANAHRFSHRLAGFDDIADTPRMRYYRAVVYGNTKLDNQFIERLAPPWMRAKMMSYASPDVRESLLDAPFSYAKMLGAFARIHALEPKQGLDRWMDVLQDYIDNRRAEAAGVSDADLQLMSDEALIAYAEDRCDYEQNFIEDIYLGFEFHIKLIAPLFAEMIEKLYTGANPGVLIDLLTGSEKQTITVRESLALWDLANRIRSSDKLTKIFRDNQDGSFFTKIENSTDGRKFLNEYEIFLRLYGHRGHSDRDIYFIRRAEDPMVDYRLLGAFLGADPGYDPREVEERALRKKHAALDDIVSNFASQELGSIKVELFKLLNAYSQRLLVIRDDERGFIDISTFTIKRCFVEINRRLMIRGVFDSERDFYFLSRQELYEVARGRADIDLVKMKISGRKRNFELVNSKEITNPMFLQNNRPLVEEIEVDDGKNLKGTPTSGGLVTGRARVVKHLEEISRIRQGEIMICNSTDPGWTPVFLLLAGAVFETGGVFAHCSCLSREYGIPAVQVPGALKKIPDGALIAIDGHAGTVTIVENAVETV